MLRNAVIGAPPEIEFSFGPANQGWLPIAGDWNGQGYDKVGVYDPVTGLFILAADHNRNEYRRIETKPPSKTWKPVAGDWLDMGYDSLGLFDPDSNGFHLLEAGPGGWGEAMFQFGISGVEGLPVAVRWDADAVQELSLTNLQHESLNKKEGPHA